MACRVQDLRHAAIRERSQARSNAAVREVGASADRIREIVERGLGTEELPPEREQAAAGPRRARLGRGPRDSSTSGHPRLRGAD